MTETIRERIARETFDESQNMAVDEHDGFIRRFWNELSEQERKDWLRLTSPALNILSEPGEEDVERVARGLAALEYERDVGTPMPADFAGPDYQWQDWSHDARAAIKSYVSGGEG